MNLSTICLLLLTPAFNFAGHVAFVRLFKNRGWSSQKMALYSILFSSGAVGGWSLILFLSSTTFQTDTLKILGGLFCVFVPLLLGHVYFHLFNMSETARRIRILLLIRQGKFSIKEEHYSPQRLIEIRLERLKALGQVRVQGSSLLPKTTLLSLVAHGMEIYEHLLFPSRA